MWTPEGKRIIYRGTRTGFRNIYWRAADGTGDEERLTTSDNVQTPGSISPDGKWLAFSENFLTAGTGNDIWFLPLDGDRKPEPFLTTPFNEGTMRLSPDGHWLAYTSNQSGRNQIYVEGFPHRKDRSQLSTEGGSYPVWARDGRELFYLSGDKMMAVNVTTQPTFAAESPRLLFESRYERSQAGVAGYDVSADGKRFLMIQSSEPEQPTTQIQIVLNWFEELKQHVPVR
jgi:Tol biopolymer transport system component